MKVTLNKELNIDILMKRGSMNFVRMSLDTQSITSIITEFRFVNFEMYSSSGLINKT